MATIFMEPGTDATFGFEFWSSTSGTAPTSDSAVKNTGPRSMKFNATAATSIAKKTGVLADAGRRVSLWANFNTALALTQLLQIQQAGGSVIGTLRLDASKILNFLDGGGITSKSGSTVLSDSTWYQIVLTYVFTSVSNYTIKVYLNNALELTVTQADFTLTRVTSDTLWLGIIAAVTATVNVDDVYIDDSAALTDLGAVRVTAKLPAADNVITWNRIGADPGAGLRFQTVSARALSTANGGQDTGMSQTPHEDSYTLEAASAGDVDISAQTLIARTAWVYAGTAGGAAGNTAFDLVTSAGNTGKSTGTTLTLGPVTVVVNDLAVVAFADQVAGSAPTIADDLGQSWTALAGPTTNTARISKWYSRVTVAGSMTVTITFGSSNNSRAGAVCIYNNIAATPLDANPANANDATSPYDTPATGALAQTNELVLGFGALAGPVGDVVAATDPDGAVQKQATTGGSAGSNSMAVMIMRLVRSTTTVTPQFTDTTANRTGVLGTATFKAAKNWDDGALVDNGDSGLVVSIALGAADALYTKITDSAVYPSNVAGIGMLGAPSGSVNRFKVYECGTLIAYAPGAPDTSFHLAIFRSRMAEW
jgi:hypothetical protein